MLKTAIFSVLLLLSLGINAHEVKCEYNEKSDNSPYIWISLGSDAIAELQKTFPANKVIANKSNDGITLIQVREGQVNCISAMMHEKFKRCGGFVVHDSEEKGLEELYASPERSFGDKAIIADYSINRGDLVRPLIEKVRALKIQKTIEKLSSFKNRYYKAKTGVDSQSWLKSHWEKLTAARTDASVAYFKHDRWPQPSLIATIKGKTDDVIVIGGHADSIAGFWGRERASAPGADDNASGIATTTEIMRLILESGYQPEKTIKFMAYAAEEVGLLGSKEIATSFKQKGVNVVGALQLDMTNYKGSEVDIVMMTDFTNEGQNAFLGKLIDAYLPTIKWGYDKCGYACSDHASWNRQGYPVSMPFESKKNDMNGKIHTGRDTIAQSGGNAEHAAKFARMGVAFVLELDK
tara:strand:- start:205046 stop:206269 length:1224 start_codon:yes stop_codon:yes gene_type:complete